MLSICDNGAAAPCPTSFNMAAHVLRHADELNSKTALSLLGHDHAEDISFGALKSAILGTATGLLNAGLRRGDIVLMRLGNTVDFPISYLACIAVGLIPVPTSSMLTPPEVAKMTAELSPRMILHDGQTALPPVINCPVLTTQDLASFRDLPPAEFDFGDPNRLAYIIYTSGTSGQPRAVCHAHRAIWARQMMQPGWTDLRPSDRLLHAGAFNWTYTLGTGLMDPWSVGATALIPNQGVEIAELHLLIDQHNATILAAAPGVFRKIIASFEQFKPKHLRHGLSAGEKLSDTLRATWHAKTGTHLYEAYGMSECSTFISASPTAPAQPGTLGRPQSGRRVALVDQNGPVPLGTEGTIAVHRDDPGLMLGYFNPPNDTTAKFTPPKLRGDWFLTGDQGVMHPDHSITYAGRADDMMNAGGYRVSPIEVEAALSQFPGIQQIGATDVQVKQDVRVIAAFYTAEADLNIDALQQFATQTLAAYKQPRIFQRLPALPTNPNGKLSRSTLRQNFEASK